MRDYKHEYALWKQAKGTQTLPDGRVVRKVGQLRIIYARNGQRHFRWASYMKPKTKRQDTLYVLQLLLVITLLKLC